MSPTEKIFMEFWHWVGGDGASGKAAYTWIRGCYDADGRYYHDWTHVEEMVQRLYAHFSESGTLVGNPSKAWGVIYAAFMHDIYTPGAPGDVHTSSMIATSVLTGAISRLDLQFLLFAGEAVLATRDHKSDDPYIQRLVDADLARFSVGNWRIWANLIGYEYEHVPPEQYNLGRRAVLERFAARTPFYYHSWDDLSDEVAYENIRQQIADTYPKEEDKVPTAFDELQELKAAYDAAVKDKGQEVVDAIFKTAFDEIPEIQSIAWTQGTPSFNDGDPCVFSVHEPSIILDAAGARAFDVPEGDRADQQGGDEDDYGNQIPAGGYSFDGYGLYDSYHWGGEHPNRVKVWTNDRHRALSELHDRLSASMQTAEDVLESVFDGNARVTVTRDGYDVDEYYDY